MRIRYLPGGQLRCWVPAMRARNAVPVCRAGIRPVNQSRSVAMRSMSPVRDTEEHPSELNERTIQELMEMGMTREEAEAEAAWDPTEADPLQGQSMSFDNLYSLNDEVPEDVREELTRVGYGPPAMIAAGFRLEEYAVMRYLMDGVGANQVRLLIADEEMLHKPLDEGLKTPEIDWESPRPEEAIHGGGWGSSRACLFSGLSVAQQGALIEILEGQGIDNIAVCAAVPQAAQEPVGKLLSEAVLEDQRRRKEEKRETERQARAKARAKEEAEKTVSEGSGAQKIPSWADDADPNHVVSDKSGRLPDIREELRDRIKTVTDNVRKAETTDDIDLNTGLSKDEIAQRKAFLQGLLPEDKLEDYLKDWKKSEDDDVSKFNEEDLDTAAEAKKEAENAVLSGDPDSDSFPPVYETYEENKARKAAESAKPKTEGSEEEEKIKDIDPSWRMAAPGELWEGMGDVKVALDEAAAETKMFTQKERSETEVKERAEKDASLIRDNRSNDSEDPSAGYVEQMQQLPEEESIQSPHNDEDLFPDATVVSASSASPYFTTQEESDSKVQSMKSQTIDVVADSLAELAPDDSATSTGALGDLSALRDAFKLQSSMASALDDVILGDEESEASGDDEAWLEGQMGASKGRAHSTSVRSRRAQRDARPKPNMPDSIISQTSMHAPGDDEGPIQNAQYTNSKSNSTLPWLKPDDQGSRTHVQSAKRDADSVYKVPKKSAEDSSMDAISRALKSGVDKETLKRYIDEVADTVADNAGSWLRDQPKKKEVTKNSDALADALRTAKQQEDNIEYGPPIPPKNPNWSMQEEVAAENAERMKKAQRAQRDGAAMLNGAGTGDPDKDEEGPRLESSLSKDSHSMNDLRLKEKRKGPDVENKVHSASPGANFKVPGVNDAPPQDSLSDTPAPEATPNLRWDRYNSAGTNSNILSNKRVHTSNNGVNTSGLDVDSGAQLSDTDRIRMMDDENLPSNMGKLRNPSDRGQGGSVETSIGELLDDEEAPINSDLYGEEAAFYGTYKPQGNVFARKEASSAAARDASAPGLGGEQMKNFASGWRRGTQGEGMNRVREMYSDGSFSEDSAAKMAAEHEAQLQAEREFDEMAQEGEKEAAARPATLEQLKAAAERHGLDLQKLIADAKAKGVNVEGA